ncbi:UDP-glycosyltransferase UGT4-like [Uranotaenia lowii]|uniref:UDP-glycosyltransferase UGT4-like n=1 Tax=Uranotaenia lowii TaxID=190385 RepID=UPI00247929B2|nr:UDP-glycosyltransferase UGT4-like [Uranotaenia lowii]
MARLMSMVLLCWVSIAGSGFHVHGARILTVFPTMGKSHVLGLQALMKNLAERGHEVTFVSMFPLSTPVKNYREVLVEGDDSFGPLMSSFMKGENRNMFKMMPIILGGSLNYTNGTLQSPQFQKLVREEKFDLVVVGWFMNDFVVGVGSLFDCPTVLYCSAGFISLTNMVGNPVEVSSVPHLMLGNMGPMTFWDRVKNTLFNTVDSGIKLYIKHTTRPFYDYNFPAEKGFPSYEEAKRKVSLVFYNSHFTQTVPRPYLPNMVEIGGLQIKPKPDPLPKDIQTWLDGADQGAIFVSFGSNLKSSSLRQDKLDAIIATLSKLKQRIIWKWDTEEMPGKPSNVMIGKWLPQDDILAHKNLKLFVTHGGLGSVTESMYHAVPIVGVPIFGDQEKNIAQVVKEGWGLEVAFEDLTEQTLTSAIDEVLKNPKYTEKVTYKSKLYKDRPQSAMELATFWIEYIIRHKGADHLHYQGADLNFVQRNLLDVFALFGAVLYLVFKIVALIFGKLKRLICGAGKSKSKQKKH